MIYGPPIPTTARTRAVAALHRLAGSAVRAGWSWMERIATIDASAPAARRFASFGDRSVICFPAGSHVNTNHIAIGANTLIAPGVTLSAGWGPGHPGLPEVVVTVGDRCLIGRGSSLIGHRSVRIGNDVWTGYDVRIGDMNHGYEDLEVPIGAQFQAESPVTIGDGSWLGHGVIVLPGVTIGHHVTVGAGSVVTGDLPDHSVAVGVPARVVRRLGEGGAWEKVPAHQPLG